VNQNEHIKTSGGFSEVRKKSHLTADLLGGSLALAANKNSIQAVNKGEYRQLNQETSI
jgi:hypothetical protein